MSLACVLALVGCSASVTVDPPTPTPDITTPAQGSPLSAWGLTHYPSELIWLPTGVRLTYQADQPNLLNAVGLASQSDLVQTYLSHSLEPLGWQITDEVDGGLMFEQGQWRGGFVRGQDTWALTVRND